MRAYTNALAAVTAQYPSATYTARERKNVADNYSPVTENGTVPGSSNAYTVELEFGILQQATLTVTDTTSATVLTPIKWGLAPASGECSVHYDAGWIRAHSSREGHGLRAVYQPLGSVESADIGNRVQAELVAITTDLRAKPPHLQNTDTGTSALTFEVGKDRPASDDSVTSLILSQDLDFSRYWVSLTPEYEMSGEYRLHLNGASANDVYLYCNGRNITSLNATNLASGTVADARLSSNVGLKNGTNTWSGSNTFSSTVSLNSVTSVSLANTSPLDATALTISAGTNHTGTVTNLIGAKINAPTKIGGTVTNAIGLDVAAVSGVGATLNLSARFQGKTRFEDALTLTFAGTASAYNTVATLACTASASVAEMYVEGPGGSGLKLKCGAAYATLYSWADGTYLSSSLTNGHLVLKPTGTGIAKIWTDEFTVSSAGSAAKTRLAVGTATIPSSGDALQVTGAILATTSIRSNTGFNVNGSAGYSGTATWRDADSVTHTMTISGGIITAYSAVG